MTNMEIVLAALTEPMSLDAIAEKTGLSRQSVRWATAKLRNHECIRSCGMLVDGAVRAKLWVATGKPFVPMRTSVRAQRYLVETAHYQRKPGSGVIAPSPYAYGYLWGVR